MEQPEAVMVYPGWLNWFEQAVNPMWSLRRRPPTHASVRVSVVTERLKTCLPTVKSHVTLAPHSSVVSDVQMLPQNMALAHKICEANLSFTVSQSR
ncbi:hypothetical protein T265_09077 [Opisthorchis viverrini]|uniref:Uncharacterized protein n=1 Tax=Opisthorchis viverrini TaxID=6198 RepID=A0A075A678_OPIVI|nr:hypothetical protein T265_09077 [Opisthorchis viverrini]KER22949.1 hypothetical protein T265_09077 [Opisthorchis viverrini]